MKAHAWKVCIRETVSRVRIPLPPPFQPLRGHFVCAAVRHQRLEQPGLRSHDADLAFGDLDPLGERAQVIAAIAAAFEPDALAGGAGKLAEHLWRDRLAP